MSKCVKETCTATVEVMKSRFIAYLFPLPDPDAFKDILNALRKEHKKARHIVYAYRVHEKTKSCDDQEPKGTAGRPLLEILLKQDIDETALVVVRYFGGTLLGAGRLLRTYVSAGTEVIRQAKFNEI